MQVRGFLLALALLAPLARADEAPTGPWRIEGRDAEGRPFAGRLHLSGGGYEREVRADLRAPFVREVGGVSLEAGRLRLSERAGAGFAQELAGKAPRGSAAAASYARSGAGWAGERREADGRRSTERLLPLRALDRNEVELLIDGQAYPSMEAAIRAARRSIDLQTFQWADDASGRRIAEALMARAREGVRVRLLVDGASAVTNQMVSLHIEEPKVDFTGRIYRKGLRRNLRIRDSLQAEMARAGCQVIVAHKDLESIGGSLANVGHSIANGFKRLFTLGRSKPEPREARGVFNHDHRKIMIVDERVAFCGGMNIASEYEHDWHDVQVRVEGPAAHGFHQMFVDRWQAAGGRGEVEPAPCEAWTGDVPVEAMGSIPGIDHCLRDLYLREIRQARERIMIEVAYFLDDRIIEALGQAAQRGVRTVVIVPSDEKNDVYLVKEAFAWVHNDVVRSGVELYFFQPTLTHAKLAVFDGERATVGSQNLDKLALDDIAEANAWIPDARFAREVEERIFAVDLPRSVRAVERPLGWRRWLTARSLSLFRGLL